MENEPFAVNSSTRAQPFQTDADIRKNLAAQADIPVTLRDQITFSDEASLANYFGDSSLEQTAGLPHGAVMDDEPANGEALFAENTAEPFTVSAADSPQGGAPSASSESMQDGYSAERKTSSATRGRQGDNQAANRVRQAADRMISETTDSDMESASANHAGLLPYASKSIWSASNVAYGAQGLWHIGRESVHTATAVKRGALSGKEALSAEGKLLAREGRGFLYKSGKGAASALAAQAEAFRVPTDDFSGSTVTTIKDAGIGAVRGIFTLKNIFANPKRLLIGAGVAGVLVLGVAVVSILNSAVATVVTSVLCAEETQNVQSLVNYINEYRNDSITTEIYDAFRGETDPNGNPYGYSTLTGRRSNNRQHGVTWSYANGISNDTAEIISLATVYYQQEWPPASAFSSFSGYDFFEYCRDLTAYGLDVVAAESAPYSCLTYGGCYNGYRSEGETVTVTDYRSETHTCAEGGADCGQYIGSGDTRRWQWADGHGSGEESTVWVEDGTHDVTIYFPLVLPETAAESELCDLPDEVTYVSEESKISAADCTGNIVLNEDTYNLYTGALNDWFVTTDDEFVGSFTVVTGEGDDTREDTYEVTFSNATAIPWCPGELHDGQYGHYDLNCTIYMLGCDQYSDPEITEPDGEAGGSGNLQALAQKLDGGTLTRTVIKQNQYGSEYTGNATAARYTKTITLPAGADGFTAWYMGGEDSDGNVAWAELLYKMDWEGLYGVTDGIKCRTVGTIFSAEELDALLAGLGLDGDSARAQVVAWALSCQGQFSYGQPTSLRGGVGAPVVGANLDCSSFVQYCFWAVGLPFSAGNTAAYASAGDLTPISSSQVQPGDLRVVYAQGGTQGHVQMYVGAGSWIECCYGYGVGMNLSNAFMTSNPCHYFTYAGF